jgi:hypothetical protein
VDFAESQRRVAILSEDISRRRRSIDATTREGRHFNTAGFSVAEMESEIAVLSRTRAAFFGA